MLHELAASPNDPRSPLTAAPSIRHLLSRSWELLRTQWLLFAVLVLWTSAPILELAVNTIRHGGVMAGSYGFDSYDQLAYLAWIRDSANHWLASNLWQIPGTPHDYLHPMFFLSGLLVRLGLGIQAAYLLWVPIALLVLFLGAAAYVRRMLPDSRGEQLAGLALSLFYVTPVLAVAIWTHHLSPAHRFDLVLTTDDANTALNLWGFCHTAITIGLLPVFLVACEKLLAVDRAAPPARRGWTVIASISGALISWLHPWQGAMVLVIVAALAVIRPPRRRFLALAIPVIFTVLPLIYGEVLSHADPSWRTFQARTSTTGPSPLWALLASLGPLGLLALFGVRRPHSDGEWMLLLWVPACAAIYYLVPEFPPHALSGVTIPLAVLAVRGWRRLRMPALAAALAAAALILVFTVPAAVNHIQDNRSDFTDPTHVAARQLVLLSAEQRAALSYLASAPPGGVLAPGGLSLSVPGFTGHPAYSGHFMWQPAVNNSLTNSFFDPALRDPTGARRRAIVSRSGVRYVIADCGAPAGLARALAPVAHPVRRFGCLTVYARS